MTSLQTGNIRLQKLLHELQVDTNRLKERQDARPLQVAPKDRQLSGRGENSPDVLLQNAAGEDFIARGQDPCVCVCVLSLIHISEPTRLA